MCHPQAGDHFQVTEKKEFVWIWPGSKTREENSNTQDSDKEERASLLDQLHLK